MPFVPENFATSSLVVLISHGKICRDLGLNLQGPGANNEGLVAKFLVSVAKIFGTPGRNGGAQWQHILGQGAKFRGVSYKPAPPKK